MSKPVVALAVVPLVVPSQADGVLQRLMFAVAYAWYIREALALLPQPTAGAVASTAG